MTPPREISYIDPGRGRQTAPIHRLADGVRRDQFMVEFEFRGAKHMLVDFSPEGLVRQFEYLFGAE